MRVAAALVIAIACATPPAHADRLRPPPLDEPAALSAHAASTLLTAVTRAGGRVIAVGERGTVLLSDDQGVTWRQARYVPVSVTLTGVRFASDTSGWVIGHAGTILHTDDGGETWVREMDGVQASSIVLAAARSMPPGPDRAAQIRNAEQFVSDGPDKPFLDLQITSAEVLAVGAYGLALRSSDKGAHWSSAVDEFADPQGLHIYHLASDGATRIAVGEQGLILVSHNGAVFVPASLKHRGTFFGVVATRDAILTYGLQGAIFRSTDHGASWAPVFSGVEAALACATVLDDGRIVIGSLDGLLLVSRDDGASFKATSINLQVPVSGIVQSGAAVVITGARGVARLALSRLEGAS